MTYSTKNMGKRILLQDWSLKQRPKHGITKNGHTCVKVVFKPCFLQVWPEKPRFWPFLLPYLQGIGPTRVVATGMAITKRAKQRVMGLHDSRTHARLVGE